MNGSLPIIIIAIVLILVALALIELRNRGKLKQPRNKKIFLPLFITGFVLALAGAFLCLMAIFWEKILQALQRLLVL